MKHEEITSRVIGAAIEVHEALGPGLLESAYEACLAHALSQRGLRVRRQVEVPVVFQGVRVDCGYRIDLLVEEAVIVELKAKREVTPIDEAQLLSHMKLSDIEVGLLMNFHVVRLKDGIKRMVL